MAQISEMLSSGFFIYSGMRDVIFFLPLRNFQTFS